jgi:hypothetical protein
MKRIELALFATVTATVLFAGLLVWRAEATPLSGSVEPFAVSKSYSPVQKASCMFGTSRCTAGTKWMCTRGSNANGETKKCRCRPC